MTMNHSVPVIFTVGHSTRSFEELVAILRAHGVKRLVDVRRVPRSRHNPQFNRDTLPVKLRRPLARVQMAVVMRKSYRPTPVATQFLACLQTAARGLAARRP